MFQLPQACGIFVQPATKEHADITIVNIIFRIFKPKVNANISLKIQLLNVTHTIIDLYHWFKEKNI